MEVDESLADRRARLRLLAKKRMSQLASGETPLPHTASADDEAAAASGASLTQTLLDSGSASFSIESHVIEVTEKHEESAEGQRFFHIKVDEVYVEAMLHCFRVVGGHAFNLVRYGSLELVLPGQDFGFHREDNVYAFLYNALFGSANKQAFVQYLARRTKAQDDTYRQIVAEAEQFKDVLVRKYRQLVFTDEYKTTDESRFIDELRRFASKRLPGVDERLVVPVAHALVLEWLKSLPPNSGGLTFDPSMSPVDYERYCAALLSQAGWSTQLTATSGDQGADVICEAEGCRLVVQCKLYSSSVGNSAVQEVIAARQFQFADAAAVVSNAPFTRSARELANVAHVLLLHHDALQRLCPKDLTTDSNEAK